MALMDAVEDLVRQKPGLTEIQIAEAIYGERAYQQRVNPTCRKLLAEKRVERRGNGYYGDPYTYHPVEAHAGV